MNQSKQKNRRVLFFDSLVFYDFHLSCYPIIPAMPEINQTIQQIIKNNLIFDSTNFSLTDQSTDGLTNMRNQHLIKTLLEEPEETILMSAWRKYK